MTWDEPLPKGASNFRDFQYFREIYAECKKAVKFPRLSHLSVYQAIHTYAHTSTQALVGSNQPRLANAYLHCLISILLFDLTV